MIDSLCPAEMESLLGEIEYGHIKKYGLEICGRALKEITAFFKENIAGSLIEIKTSGGSD